jgi:predicted DCC family thiol-disulfide oxidoreductase YuxK
MQPKTTHKNEVILFDGECNLCNGFVNFVIDRDHKQRFVFTSLQSKAGIKIQNEAGILIEDTDSIILYDPDSNSFKEKSAAIIHILRHFKSPWPLIRVFQLIPRFIRNFIYDSIARNRYRWFGKTSCRIPTPELKKRFL